MCSDKTDCEALLAQPPSGDSSLVLDSAPDCQIIDAAGFRGDDVAVFNGRWTLASLPGKGPEKIWRNEGGGPAQPEIELSVPVCCSGECRLVFRRGPAIVRYTMCRSQWARMGINQFAGVWIAGVAEGSSVPTILNVRPG
jgi:hypothetical protein